LNPDRGALDALGRRPLMIPSARRHSWILVVQHQLPLQLPRLHPTEIGLPAVPARARPGSTGERLGLLQPVPAHMDRVPLHQGNNSIGNHILGKARAAPKDLEHLSSRIPGGETLPRVPAGRWGNYCFALAIRILESKIIIIYMLFTSNALCD